MDALAVVMSSKLATESEGLEIAALESDWVMVLLRLARVLKRVVRAVPLSSSSMKDLVNGEVESHDRSRALLPRRETRLGW